MPRKILFIINPNAGKKVPKLIIQAIRDTFPKNIYYHIVVWQDKDHFEEIRERLLSDGYSDAIAVGGDGTVNQVASAILGTGIRLGIIPVGSGNGLARTLGISTVTIEAVRQIAEGRSTLIDHGQVNGQPFFCTSGMGFDAHIGHLFASLPERGLRSYVKLTSREVFRYKAHKYEITIGDKVIERSAFLVTVANAGQYGNDFYIAPEALLSDGLFQVVILRPFSLWRLPAIALKMMRRRAHRSAFIETITASRVRIRRLEGGAIHFDGEPAFADHEVFFEMIPRSLAVIVGQAYEGDD
jgi:diacylglycerol kinase (ATP)